MFLVCSSFFVEGFGAVGLLFRRKDLHMVLFLNQEGMLYFFAILFSASGSVL